MLAKNLILEREAFCLFIVLFKTLDTIVSSNFCQKVSFWNHLEVILIDFYMGFSTICGIQEAQIIEEIFFIGLIIVLFI